MKHLRKYNESNEVDMSYVRDCFVDFIDEGAENDFIRYKGELGWEIAIENSMINLRYFNTKDLLEKIKRFEEIVTDLEVCIEKLKIKFPKIKTIITLERDVVHCVIQNLIKL